MASHRHLTTHTRKIKTYGKKTRRVVNLYADDGWVNDDDDTIPAPDPVGQRGERERGVGGLVGDVTWSDRDVEEKGKSVEESEGGRARGSSSSDLERGDPVPSKRRHGRGEKPLATVEQGDDSETKSGGGKGSGRVTQSRVRRRPVMTLESGGSSSENTGGSDVDVWSPIIYGAKAGGSGRSRRKRSKSARQELTDSATEGMEIMDGNTDMGSGRIHATRRKSGSRLTGTRGRGRTRRSSSPIHEPPIILLEQDTNTSDDHEDVWSLATPSKGKEESGTKRAFGNMDTRSIQENTSTSPIYEPQTQPLEAEAEDVWNPSTPLRRRNSGHGRRSEQGISRASAPLLWDNNNNNNTNTTTPTSSTPALKSTVSPPSLPLSQDTTLSPIPHYDVASTPGSSVSPSTVSVTSGTSSLSPPVSSPSSVSLSPSPSVPGGETRSSRLRPRFRQSVEVVVDVARKMRGLRISRGAEDGRGRMRDTRVTRRRGVRGRMAINKVARERHRTESENKSKTETDSEVGSESEMGLDSDLEVDESTAPLEPLDALLSLANQESPVPFHDVFPTTTKAKTNTVGLCKIGESTYAQVFTFPYVSDAHTHTTYVAKIIPFTTSKVGTTSPSNQQTRNRHAQQREKEKVGEHGGEEQSSAHAVLQETLITKHVSRLPGFLSLCRLHICQGRWTAAMIRAWRRYAESRHQTGDGSDRSHDHAGADDGLKSNRRRRGRGGRRCQATIPQPPTAATTGRTQLSAVLVIPYAGTDLEMFEFGKRENGERMERGEMEEEVWCVLRQVVSALGNAELEGEFEHRDLHWGNVLLTRVENDDQNTDDGGGKVRKGMTFVVPTSNGGCRLNSNINSGITTGAVSTEKGRDDKKEQRCRRVVTLPPPKVRVTLIDYTLARLSYRRTQSRNTQNDNDTYHNTDTNSDTPPPPSQSSNGPRSVLYTPLTDPDLFTGSGDPQYDVYRAMRDLVVTSPKTQKLTSTATTSTSSTSTSTSMSETEGWAGFYPRTNVLWVLYLIDKCLEKIQQQQHKQKQEEEEENAEGTTVELLKRFRERVEQYSSCWEVMEHEVLSSQGMLSDGVLTVEEAT
ncbi:hypothetical protein HDU85_002690 [Gaertneriomyces sp. JEL0708]|nr:hypothetical protein HDU85_002690 [Gaertneriomyces sp. JEL0708]